MKHNTNHVQIMPATLQKNADVVDCTVNNWLICKIFIIDYEANVSKLWPLSYQAKQGNAQKIYCHKLAANINLKDIDMLKFDSSGLAC